MVIIRDRVCCLRFSSSASCTAVPSLEPELLRLRPRLCIPLAILVSGDKTRSFFTINDEVKCEAALFPMGMLDSLSLVMLMLDDELIDGKLSDIAPDVDDCVASIVIVKSNKHYPNSVLPVVRWNCAMSLGWHACH